MSYLKSNFRSISPFKELNDGCILDALFKHTVQWDAGKHQTLVRENTPVVGVSAVLAGAVMLWKTRSDGQNQVVGFLFPGDVIGAAAQNQHITSARALTNCEMMTIDRTVFGTLCRDYPALQHAIYGRILNDLTAVQEQLVILGLLNARERLAAGLLQLQKRQVAQRCTTDARVWLPMRRTDLACYLGLQLPTLSRAFATLRSSGAIASHSMTEVEIRDRQALQALAGTE